MNTIREDTLLQQALQAARAKHELTARELFLEVIKINHRNEIAWMWLTGLLDNLDERIHACERVLDINPNNKQARQYLSQLMKQKQRQLDESGVDVQKQIETAFNLAKNQKRDAALSLMRDAVLSFDANPDAWRFIADLSSDMDEQIHALDKLVTLVPQDIQARETLDRLRYLKKNPHELAAIHEEAGDIDKAIDYYNRALMQDQLKDKWYDIDQKIVGLKMRLNENIEHVPPSVSIARLAAGPPLLYFLLILMEAGIHPIANPEPILWMGFLLNLLGGFMIAIATIRSHHRLWFIVFRDVSSGGSPLARTTMLGMGWILLLISFFILFVTDYQRLLQFIFETVANISG